MVQWYYGISGCSVLAVEVSACAKSNNGSYLLNLLLIMLESKLNMKYHHSSAH